MISIYKISKEGFKTIFAIDFLDNEFKFFFFIDGTWEMDIDKIDTKSMESIYGELIDVDLLKDLELSERIDLPDGGCITCLAKFDDVDALEKNSANILDFLATYAQMIHLDNDF